MLIYNKIYLEKIFPPAYPISNFTFSSSINSLPTLSITRPIYSLRSNVYGKKENIYTTAISGEDIINDFSLKYQTSSADGSILNIDAILYNLEFNLVSKNSDNILEYVMFNKLNRVICSKTMTLCQTYVSDVINYFNNLLNQPSGYTGLSSIDYNFILGRIDVDNTTLVDFLNSLEDYGLYWYINYKNGSIVIKRYDNFTSSGNLRIIGDYSINVEKREFQGIRIIKEAYESILEDRIHIEEYTEYNLNLNKIQVVLIGGCSTAPITTLVKNITFKTPVKPYLYNWNITVFSADPNYPTIYSAYAIIYYNKEKIYIKILDQNSTCFECDVAIFSYIAPNGVKYYFKYKSNTWEGCINYCAGEPWSLFCSGYDVCKAEKRIDDNNLIIYDNCSSTPPERRLNRVIGSLNDCYEGVEIIAVGPEQKRVIIDGYLNTGNLSSGICLENPEDSQCILTGDYLKQYEIYLGNNLYKNCAVEKRFNGITSTVLYNLIVPYYQTMLNNPDRIIVNGYIWDLNIPQVGERYNVIVGDRVINSMLLRSIEITPEGMRGEFVWPF